MQAVGFHSTFDLVFDEIRFICVSCLYLVKRLWFEFCCFFLVGGSKTSLRIIMFLIVLVLCSFILLALFMWNKSITPTVFELRGSHILVGALSVSAVCCITLVVKFGSDFTYGTLGFLKFCLNLLTYLLTVLPGFEPGCSCLSGQPLSTRPHKNLPRGYS